MVGQGVQRQGRQLPGKQQEGRGFLQQSQVAKFRMGRKDDGSTKERLSSHERAC